MLVVSTTPQFPRADGGTGVWIQTRRRVWACCPRGAKSGKTSPRGILPLPRKAGASAATNPTSPGRPEGARVAPAWRRSLLAQQEEAQHARAEAERAREAASAEAERAIERSEAAEHAARAAAERSEAADARADRAEQRTDRVEERARKDRAGFEHDLERLRQDFEARLAAQQERAQTANVARERAQAALDADR